MPSFWSRPRKAVMSVCRLMEICTNCLRRFSLDKNIKHNIEIVVDRLIVKPGIEKRLTDSIETVLELAEGLLMVDTMDGEYP